MSDSKNGSFDEVEISEWRGALRDVYALTGSAQVRRILDAIDEEAAQSGVTKSFPFNTPYLNTIPLEKQPPFPGSREIERRLKSIIRWNAMAMVVRANKDSSAGIGGHISTFASAATLYEVGFNHFWRARGDAHPGDLIFFQGHASPGIYSRAFVEGRLTTDHLDNFRRELQPGGGLSSYPHPWLMPEFWQFPTVSMGLGPIMAIAQARMIKYQESRGLKPPSDQRVWAFLGDGECDEPESLGPIALAGREHLDNLTFVINCNLQRLDGPVRGNSQIVQELEARFRAAGWNVVKALWGSEWDELLARDKGGFLARRFSETVDGQFQKYSTAPGPYIREHFFGKYPQLAALIENISDDGLKKLRRGGHDPAKIYAAYKAAMDHKGQPTVVLAKTVKGYGLGESGEGKNIAHNQKKLNEEELREFRTRFGIPLSDKEVATAPFFKPDEKSVEMQYLHERRAALGGYLPKRNRISVPIDLPDFSKAMGDMYKGTDGREVSTTMAVGQILGRLLKDKAIGKLIVPIIPDEARTFGMESLFSSCGIYNPLGQLYEPVDRHQLQYYKESKDGQLFQEGINEAGAMSTFIAAATAYSNHGVNLIPFYIFYSMFGFQRIGDLVWAGADSRARGFLIGGTAGRTTLNGEGLQHEDGHSHVMAATVPNCLAYDPAFAFEIAVIIEDGIRRMFMNNEDVFYYITAMNENWAMPPMPEGEGVREGILRGCYKFKAAEGKATVNILGSGAMMNEALKAQALLHEKYGVEADVYSVTSYKALIDDALECDRWNLLHPDETPRIPYIQSLFRNGPDLFVTTSDYMKILSDSLARFIPGTLQSLGTNGFGRSESRAALRDFFEVDHRYVVLAALRLSQQKGLVPAKTVKKVLGELGLTADKPNPLTA